MMSRLWLSLYFVLLCLGLALAEEAKAQTDDTSIPNQDGVRQEPSDPEARSLLGACRLGAIDKCTSFIEWAQTSKDANINETLSEAYYSRGHAYLGKGKGEKALEDFQKLQVLQPTAFGTFLSLADAYAATGEAEKALALYTRLLKTRRLPAPVKAVLYMHRGIAFGEKQEHKKAIEDYTTALNYDISLDFSMKVYRNRGKEYTLAGNLSFAIDDFNKLAQLQTGRGFVEPDVYYYRGMAYAMQQQHRLALKDFERALEVNAQLKRKPWTDPKTGKQYKFTGKIEVDVEEQRTAVIKAMRDASGYVKPKFITAEAEAEAQDPSKAKIHDEL